MSIRLLPLLALQVLRTGWGLFLVNFCQKRIKLLALALRGFDQHFDPAGPHIRFFSRQSLQALLETSGYAVKQITCLGRFWPFWMNMVASAERL